MSVSWKEALSRDAARASEPEYWLQIFTDRPEVLHRLIADIFTATHGVDRVPTIEEMWDLLSAPTYSTLPFPEAFERILGDRTRREVALRAGLFPSTLNKYLAGERGFVTNDVEGSMRRIELIAAALDVHPSYFAEWRRMWVMALVDRAFVVRPDLSFTMFQRLSGFERIAVQAGLTSDEVR